MPTPALTILKYVFLAFLYLFFLRVLRAVWIELREPKTVERPDRGTTDGDGQAAQSRAQVAAPVGAGPYAGDAAATTAIPFVGPDGEPTRLSVARDGPGASGAPPGRELSGRLVLVEPAGLAGLTFPLADELTVGRAPGCGVSLPEDTFVSSVHARVFNRGGAYHLEDLGSTNGTFLNGERVGGPVRLEPGDRFRVGQSVLELVA